MTIDLLNDEATKKEDAATKAMFKKIAKFILEERDRKVDEIGLLSKQITFESKKCVGQVISFFQNPKALQEAEADLKTIIQGDNMLKGLAMKLHSNKDLEYLALRRYSPAIEEFIEATALFIFFKEGRLIQWEEVQKMLTYTFKTPPPPEKRSLGDFESHEHQDNEKNDDYQIPIPATVYYLGLADITGELVRACAAGCNTANFKKFLFNSRALVQTIYRGLSLINTIPRHLNEKMKVMLSSLIKLDTACYHATVRVERFKCIVTSDFFRKPALTDEMEYNDYPSYNNLNL